MTIEIPPSLKEAYDLPTAKYRTPEIAKIKSEEIKLVGMKHIAISNATSTFPVIGTLGINPCGAIILYNKKTKTAVLNHQPWLKEDHYYELLAKVRSTPNDPVELHIIGMATDGNDVADKLVVEHLEPILKAGKATPNVTLHTFDILDKPKSYNVAIDTRNGILIRGSELFETANAATSAMSKRDTGKKTHQWHYVNIDFDGTLAEFQKKRGRA